MKSKTIKRFTFITALMLTAIIFLAGCQNPGDSDHEHIYDRKDTSFTYLKSEADCENSAQYYYSCSCGEKGSETFVYGKPADHTYSTEWTYDENAHWHAANCSHDVKSSISVHMWDEGTMVSAPTEENEGEMLYKCVVCNAEKRKAIPVLNHLHTYAKEWSSDEYIHWHGTTCGHDEKVDVAVHIWNDGEVVVAPTEKDEGSTLYRCVLCGAEKTLVVPVLGHEHTYDKEWYSDEYIHWHEATCIHDMKMDIAAHIWGDSTVITSPTEDHAGTLRYTCVICNAEKTEEIPKLEHFHTYSDEWSFNDERHWRSANCQHTSEVVGEAEHLWNNGVITTPPSDQATGIKTYTCVVCEHTKTEILPVIGHVHSFDIKNTNYLNTPADCTHKATYYYSCACGERGEALFEYGEVSSHRFVNYISDGNATCASDGTKTAKCEHCDMSNTISDIGSMKPHSYDETWTTDENYHWHVAACEHTGIVSGMGSHNWNSGVLAVAPTETEAGKMVYTCVDCSRTKTETINPTGHIHNFNIKSDAYMASPATCQSKASYYYVCACGAVGTETYEFGALGGHSFTNYVYDGNATCASDGTKTAVCAVDGCGATDNVKAEDTKLPHSFQSSWSFDANYHWHASSCGHNDQIADKDEHQWNAGTVIKNATETEEGEMKFACVVCGTSKIEAIPKINHSHVFNLKTNKYLKSAASCTSKAMYYYTCACGVVGEAVYEYGTLAKHSYDDYKSDNNATCAADGTKTRVCSVCGDEDTKVDAGTKLPHTYSDTWTFDANQHWHAGICAHTDERADVADHAWDEGVVIVAPTETTEGSRFHTCTVCDATKTEVIPHLDHVHTFSDEWSSNADKHWHAASCGHANEKFAESAHDFVLHPEGSSSATVYEDGYELYYCSVCDYEKEIVIPRLPAFTVIFYDSGYNVISEKNYALGTTEITVPTAPAKPGYSFFEWRNAATDTSMDMSIFANAAADQIYVFNPVYLKEHKVTFVDNEMNVLSSIIVLDGQYIRLEDLPEIPERVGYSSAWAASVTISMVTEDMTVSPVYNALTFDVTFLDKDGKALSCEDNLGNTVVVQSVNYGSFAITPEYPQYWFDKTTLKLYEFTGWSTDVDNITANHIGNNAIRALYDKEVDHPVVAIKISGKTANVSITLPSGAELYSFKLSGKWSNANGLCGITSAHIESISSLNKDACGETLCTVGDKFGESGWITYNNKSYTFDFLWTCGNGHAIGAENVFTLTFESPSPSFVLDESIFEILSSSSIIYGSFDADITELKKSDVFVWFYE